MALKAGRVGVAKDQVDEFGNIISSGPSGDYYTKQQTDNKFETKAHIGGLQFRSNEGQAQYKVPNGDWVNFSSGGGLDEIDFSELSPEVTTRADLLVCMAPEQLDEIAIYTDSGRTQEIFRRNVNYAVLLRNMPYNVTYYWRVYKNGTAIGTATNTTISIWCDLNGGTHYFKISDSTLSHYNFGVAKLG